MRVYFSYIGSIFFAKIYYEQIIINQKKYQDLKFCHFGNSQRISQVLSTTKMVITKQRVEVHGTQEWVGRTHRWRHDCTPFSLFSWRKTHF